VSQLAIRVDRISKQYRIGTAQPAYQTLRGALTDGIASRFRRAARPAATPRIFDALSDVSLDIERGEVLGIIGRNGAGKSTLLKVLSRITEPDAGVVDIYGRVASLLEVGTGFHPELTGRENVYLSGAILGMTRAEIERKFDDIVAFAGVEQFIDTPVKHYSSGMYLRLAFAVAAHLESEILLVDEVLAVGDAAFQAKCIGKMRETTRSGRTIVFVSHNMAAIAQLCQKVVWLDGGRVQLVAPPEEAVRTYLSHGQSQTAERRWTDVEQAPGNERVRLLAARFLQNEKVAPVVDINVPSAIEIEFAVLAEARDLVTEVAVSNTEGVRLFTSNDWRPNHVQRGRYRKRVEIPAQLFAETRLNVAIGLFFFNPRGHGAYLDDALAVDTVDSEHPLAVRGPYKGPWPGVVRVALPWTDPVLVDPPTPDTDLPSEPR
jgi:lipopolysaccharide transport system ATP-binding protein